MGLAFVLLLFGILIAIAPASARVRAIPLEAAGLILLAFCGILAIRLVGGDIRRRSRLVRRLLLEHAHNLALGQGARICARCTGIILGYVAGILLSVPFAAVAVGYSKAPAYLGYALAIPLILDWTTQRWGLRTSSNGMRLVTGFMTGAGVIIFSTSAMHPLVRIALVMGLVLTVWAMGRGVRQ